MRQRMIRNNTILKILAIKDKKKEELEIEMKKQRDAIDQEKLKLSSLQKSLLKINKTLNEGQNGRITNIYEMKLHYDYTKNVDKEIRAQQEKISKMLAELDYKQVILVNLYREIRLMEIYKEKNSKKIKKEKAISTQKEIDYLFISKWIREHSLLSILLFLLIANSLFSLNPVFAEENLVKFVKEKKQELIMKERILKKEEQRLQIMREDIDKKIEKYNKILNQIEDVLNKIKDANNERIKKIAKTYETMPPEDAVEKLSALNEKTAINILSEMKSKKVSSIIAMMDTKKAVFITESLANIGKQFSVK
jgi:flagellar export protein FliJ